MDNLNAYDGENKQKNIDKDIIVSLEDVKITNLFQDSDFTSGDQSGAVSSSEHSGAVSSSSTSRHTSASKTHSDPTGGNIPRRGTYDQLDPSRKDSVSTNSSVLCHLTSYLINVRINMFCGSI